MAMAINSQSCKRVKCRRSRTSPKCDVGEEIHSFRTLILQTVAPSAENRVQVSGQTDIVAYKPSEAT